MDKNIRGKITIKIGKIEYLWHNKSWVMLCNNLTVNTSLAQKLTELAIKDNLLTLEDILEKHK